MIQPAGGRMVSKALTGGCCRNLYGDWKATEFRKSTAWRKKKPAEAAGRASHLFGQEGGDAQMTASSWGGAPV